MGEIRRYPLHWPDNVGRTRPSDRGRPKFDVKTIAEAVAFVLAEINRLNGYRWDYPDENVIISTNIRPTLAGTPSSTVGEPSDPGVAVYFRLSLTRDRKHQRLIVLTCDKWVRASWNLYAIGKDIEAQRARHRWGCTNVEQAFRGYTAIPERTGGGSWWEVLGISPEATQDEIREAYRIKALTEHPDKGGTNERFARLQECLDQAMAKFRQ